MLLTTMVQYKKYRWIPPPPPPPPPHTHTHTHTHTTVSVTHAGAEYTHGVIFESAKYNFKPVLQEDIRWSLFYSCMLAFSILAYVSTDHSLCFRKYAMVEASLSEPHTSVTAFAEVVCMAVCGHIP